MRFLQCCDAVMAKEKGHRKIAMAFAEFDLRKEDQNF